MAFRTLKDRVESAIETLSAIAVDRPLRVACSGGKDSTVCLALAICAMRRLVAAGSRPTLLISSSNTGVENPEVVALLTSLHESAKADAAAADYDLMAEVVTPSLMEAWWPRLLAGRKLPSYVGVQGDCTVDLKIKPQSRLSKQFSRKLRARGLAEPVVVVGTRLDESSRRSANMKARGERPDAVVDGLIAPISDWSTDDVLVFLIDRDLEQYRFDHDYRSIIEFYAGASGSECIVTPEKKVGAGGGCGARSGCHVCQKVSTDASMVSLVASDEKYQYLAPLLRMNKYLSAIRWDMSRRSWLAKDVDPATGYMRLGPNCFSFSECDALLRMVITMDVEEEERAAKVTKAISEGAIEDSAQNRRMARPQFVNLDEAAIVAIDFMRGVDCFGPPHSALQAWYDVRVLGQRYRVPDIDAVPRPATLPEYRYASLDLKPAMGLFDPSLCAATDQADSLMDEDFDERFDVDPDAAREYLGFELERLVDEGTASRSPASAALRHLSYGVITLQKGCRKLLDWQMARAQALHEAGMRPAPMLPTSGVITPTEHEGLVWSAAVKEGVVSPDDPRPRTSGGWRSLSMKVAAARQPEEPEDPADVLADRVIGLRSALAAGLRVFDGVDLERALNPP